jgi:shikimate dehydrogenase
MTGVADKLSAALSARRETVTSTGRAQVQVGLVGRGIGSSRSPAMHEREGARMGIGYLYMLLDFDRLDLADTQLGEVIDAAEAAGFAGLNVTHPYKQAVIALLDTLSPEASAIGAVNTVLFADGRRIGHNTDSWGFAESFRENLPDVATGSVVQFGAGGAGAAVAHALLTQPLGQLAIVDVDMPRAEALRERLLERFGPRISVLAPQTVSLATADGVVNTTPMGMVKYPGLPFNRDMLESRHWVAEIVYFPPETALLRYARELGCRTLAGTGMAVYQAVKAFELFTGIAPDRDSMIAHFRAAA